MNQFEPQRVQREAGPMAASNTSAPEADDEAAIVTFPAGGADVFAKVSVLGYARAAPRAAEE